MLLEVFTDESLTLIDDSTSITLSELKGFMVNSLKTTPELLGHWIEVLHLILWTLTCDICVCLKKRTVFSVKDMDVRHFKNLLCTNSDAVVSSAECCNGGNSEQAENKDT